MYINLFINVKNTSVIALIILGIPGRLNILSGNQPVTHQEKQWG